MSGRMRVTVGVSDVEATATRDGLEVTVKVVRLPPGMVLYGVLPQASDVPADVRSALRVWLDKADTPGP